MEDLGFWPRFGLVALGIVISVVLPILIVAVKKAFPNSSVRSFGQLPFWRFVKPYLILGAFAAVTGLLLVLVIPIDSVATAVLTGFAWDKTLQTLWNAGKNPAGGGGLLSTMGEPTKS